ncbi:hypothetical protein KJ765_01820 [Candidatus Micrarchaeota archaeon]|nr:hypothetical protein [Candidatus Micrarchaeota archaeon]
MASFSEPFQDFVRRPYYALSLFAVTLFFGVPSLFEGSARTGLEWYVVCSTVVLGLYFVHRQRVGDRAYVRDLKVGVFQKTVLAALLAFLFIAVLASAELDAYALLVWLKAGFG